MKLAGLCLFALALPAFAACPTRQQVRDYWRVGLPSLTRQTLLYCEKEVRPWLRELLEESPEDANLWSLLTIMADPEDSRRLLQILTRASPPLGRAPVPALASALTSALLDAQQSEELDFLRKCTAGHFRSPVSSSQAALALRWLAFPQRDAATAQDLIQLLGKQLDPHSVKFQGVAGWTQNVAGDRFLVDLDFRHQLGGVRYRVSLHKVQNRWRLRGARVILHSLY